MTVDQRGRAQHAPGEREVRIGGLRGERALSEGQRGKRQKEAQRSHQGSSGQA